MSQTLRVGSAINSPQPTWNYGDPTDKDYAVYVLDRYKTSMGASESDLLGTDALISVERITLTNSDDVLTLNEISGIRLAGTDKKGGVYSITFGGNQSPDASAAKPGDLIDARNLSASDGIVVDLAAGTIARTTAKTDILLEVKEAESAYGGNGNDELIGTGGANRLDGGKGSDIVSGGAGNDTIVSIADDANDMLDGGADEDTIAIKYIDGNSTITLGAAGSGGIIGTGLNVNRTEELDTYLNFEKVSVEAGAGIDTFSIVSNGVGVDTSQIGLIDLGAQPSGTSDVIDLSSWTLDANVSLAAGTISWGSNTLSVKNAEKVIGGAGKDVLIAGGSSSHLSGGAGTDLFKVGANTIIEDGETKDAVSYAGTRIYGGVKQWWMEGGTAFWSPFSSVMSGFPVIGSAVLTAAAFFIDVATMKFASFQRDADGNLQMNLGWGHGGTASIKDYKLDLDSGVGTAGVTVFQHEWAEDFSFNNLSNYLNLALKAGFGVGLHGFDPLVLDLDGDGYELTTEGNSKAYFEFDTDGFAERTGWVRGDDALLARDANGNGKIDGITELFGNQTTSGFTMLASHDGNGDGVINASDAVYAELRVWQDANQNGVSDAGELKTLAEAGIVSINLASTTPGTATTVGGNQIVRTSSFTRVDGTTSGIADVAFDISETATKWLGDSTVSASAALRSKAINDNSLPMFLRIA